MTTHQSFRRIAPACILLLIGTVACGSGGAQLTETEFRDQANIVCANSESELASIFQEIFSKLDTATEAERQTATDGLLETLDKEIDDLAALEPPDAIADDVDAMLSTVRAGASTVREQGAGFWLDDSDPFADAEQQASALGLDACAGDTSQ